MSSFSVSSAVILFVILCTVTQGISRNSYYSLSPDIDVDFKPIREKRYVVNEIKRLANNYDKGFTSNGDSKHRAELIGDLAIRGEKESNVGGSVIAPVAQSAPSPAPNSSPPTQKTNTTLTITADAQTTTEIPDKSKKKPIDKINKKVPDLDKNNEKPTDSTTGDEPEDVDDYPKEVTNNTLAKHNITPKEDNHTYYTSQSIIEESAAHHYWADFNSEPGVTTNEMLSKSHRRASTVRLSFDFPFYGHIVRNMTVATGGFLYTGDYIHSWLASTQYIAPLMANFDTSISNESFVKYRDNGTAFTVEWSSVSLQDKKEAGTFTFQVTLHKNGDIVFVYKSIPIPVDQINDTLHPVKVGLSDAYIIDKTVFYIRKKTIYEYHRVTFNKEEIKNWSVIYMRALPTCVNLKDCYSCVNHNTSFPCRWCESIGRCSAGYDRFLQDWTNANCSEVAVSETQHCSKSTRQRDTSLAPSVEAHSNVINSRDARLGHSGILGIFVVVCLLVCLGLWVFHAYRNPHTRFGQVLIKYRPTQWRLRRGEARYTAATIHM